MTSFKTSLLLLAISAAACVSSEEAPQLIPQTEVSYGDKLWLLDQTRDAMPTLGRCTRFGTAMSHTSTVPTATVTIILDSVTATDDKAEAIDGTVPFNCYVKVAPKALKVDQVETTNALFQFCVDSDLCKTPNPADASKDQLCGDEERFGDCPVVEVPQQQAANFCTFIGRRLPTFFEQVAIRQGMVAGFADLKTYPTKSNTPPEQCTQALLKTTACAAGKPQPFTLGTNAIGAASGDIVGPSNAPIYDLMGGLSEWSNDQFTPDGPSRGNAQGLPWFCIADVFHQDPDTGLPVPPTCPSISKCVYGEYQPPGYNFGVYPVCVTTNGTFSGSVGGLAGGSYKDAPTRDTAGIFSRRLEVDPQGLPDTARAREYGIRCVDDRPSKVGDGKVAPFVPLAIVNGP